jgi:hypothetical protein
MDPNFLFEPYEHRIYADDYCNVYAVVDQEDYWHFSQWRWKPILNSRKKKIYLARCVSGAGYTKHTLYLHVAILNRKGEPQPTEAHTIADHVNGQSLLCVRHNLRWATPSMNAKNRAA